jgi:hypothetical protein
MMSEAVCGLFQCDAAALHTRHQRRHLAVEGPPARLLEEHSCARVQRQALQPAPCDAAGTRGRSAARTLNARSLAALSQQLACATRRVSPA